VQSCDEARVAEALDEARALSAGTPEHEPAALLFALSRRPLALLGKTGWDYAVLCARNLARAGGAELVIDDILDLDILRLEVNEGQAGFEEVRAFIAARLHRVR
jgi:hypothetical protein